MTQKIFGMKRSIDWMARGICLAGMLTGAILAGPLTTQAQSAKPPTGAQGGTSAPTTSPSQWATAPIKFGALQTYTHSSGWFTVRTPKNWSVQDNSTDQHALVSFTDPTENAALIIAVYGSEAPMSKDEMSTKLDDYVATTFGNASTFSTDDAQPLKTLNGAGKGFSYRQKLSNNKFVTMYGDAFYEQHDDVLTSIVVVLLPKEQYDSVKTKMYDLIDTLQVMPEHYQAQPETEPVVNEPVSGDALGDLIDYTDDAQTYFLRVPAAWSRKSGSANNLPYVTWSDTAGPGNLTVVHTQLPGLSKSTALKAAALEFIKGYAQGNKTLRNLKIIDSMVLDRNSAVAHFSYETEVDGDSIEMSASVLVRQNSKTAVFALLALPSDAIADNRNAIDEILDSIEVRGTPSPF